jgi:hypothetical protein
VVIGVMAHLAWSFLQAVAWAPSRGMLDVTALLMVAAGLWALLRWRWTVVQLLAAGAVIGLLLAFLRG